jgi:hypothetical protein
MDVHQQLAVELLNSAGKVRSVARGASMFPSIRPGDTLEIRRVAFEAVSAGDVILALNGACLCTHRVEREEFRSGRRVLITSGDALPFEDAEPVGEDEFLGRVDYIVREGKRFPPKSARVSWLSSIVQLLRQSQDSAAASWRRLSRRMLGRRATGLTLEREYPSGEILG